MKYYMPIPPNKSWAFDPISDSLALSAASMAR
ncbi:MAG: hypothetical protein ACI80P_000477, partial [Flavobacteriales bacterium]